MARNVHQARAAENNAGRIVDDDTHPSPMPIFFIREANFTVDGSMCGSDDFSSVKIVDVEEERAGNVLGADTPPLHRDWLSAGASWHRGSSNPAASEVTASQSVSTIHFLAVSGTFPSLTGRELSVLASSFGGAR